MSTNMIAVARARNYLPQIDAEQFDQISRRTLVQMAMLLPRLVRHIDAQASLLGHPRNRKHEDAAEPTMHGDRDTYDPPPHGQPVIGTITIVDPKLNVDGPIDHSGAANCRACGSPNTRYTGDCSIVCLDCLTEGGPDE